MTRGDGFIAQAGTARQSRDRAGRVGAGRPSRRQGRACADRRLSAAAGGFGRICRRPGSPRAAAGPRRGNLAGRMPSGRRDLRSTPPRWSPGWTKCRIFIADGCSPSIAWSASARKSSNLAASTMPWRSTWRLLPWPRSAANGPLIFSRFGRSATRSTTSFRPISENCLHRSRLPANSAPRSGSIFRRPAAVKDLFNLHQNALASSSRLAKFLGTMIHAHVGNSHLVTLHGRQHCP